MKKIISIAVIISVMISCLAVFAVSAAEEPTIYYSVDKSRWFELPAANFTSDTTVSFAEGSKSAKVFVKDGSASIDILDNTQFIYFYAEAPAGAVCDFYSGIDTKQSLDPWADLVDGGEWGWNKESVYAAHPVRISNENEKGDGPLTAVAVPLRLGRVDIYVNCKTGGAEKLYKASINGRWTAAANAPKISDMHEDFRVYKGDAAGYAIPMAGASVANDNQTYLYTYSKYRVANSPGNWNEQTMWVGANFSKWLEGSSYVMMPGHGMAASHEHYNDVATKFFDISTDKTYSWASGDKKISGNYGNDYIGEVVVLMPNRADKNSEYYKNADWECVNSGSTPKDGGAAFSPADKPRNYNDYEDNVNGEGVGDNSSKYYAVAIRWNNKSGYRESSPGISEDLTDVSYDSFAELNYAYRRKFRAGDIISIYSPGNISDSSEVNGLIIPIIKYYLPEETADIKDVEAKYLASGDGVPSGGAVAVHVTTLIGNYAYGRTVNAEYYLYGENGALSGVEPIITKASTTRDEFIYPCGPGIAKFLYVRFTNDEGAVIAEKKTAINP